MKFEKRDFVNAMNTLHNMYLEQNIIWERCDWIRPEWEPARWIQNYEDMIYDMCEIDPYEFNYLNLYIWELDWGNAWTPGALVINGEDIKLKTLDDIWNLITKEN